MNQNRTCFICKEKIKTGDYLQLGDKTYHTKHFCCFTCKTPLENKDFSEYEENVYCEEHYLEASNAPKCMKCLEYMIGEYCIVQGKAFHPDCFKCDYCKHPFPNSEYYKCEKNYLCQLCFGKFKANKCESCKKIITDQTWNAFGKTYHFECLVCLKCGGTFDGNGYITIDNNPFHEDCIAVYCAECDENITDEYYEIEGESIHENCLEKFQKRDKSIAKTLTKNELKELELKEKFEKNKKEKEFKDQQTKEAFLKLEGMLKKKDCGLQKQKIEEKSSQMQKPKLDEKPKGPPNFAFFMKNLKGKESNIKIVKETKIETITTSKSNEISSEINKNKESQKTLESQFREKPVLDEEKVMDKPKISTYLQEDLKKKMVNAEEKIRLNQNIEGPKEKFDEKGFMYEKIEKEIIVDKTETFIIPTKIEKIIAQKEKNEEKSKGEEGIEEKKQEKVQTVKIEKKFIKMHNKFKKI